MNKEEIKYCKFCDKEKPIKEFAKSGFAIKNICKECRNKKQKRIYQDSKKIQELENQQKEFIEYMKKTIEKLECDDVDDEDLKGYLLQRIDTFKEILQKYKEINHIAEVGKMVGGKDEK